MSTTNSGSFRVSVVSSNINADGSSFLTLLYVSLATNQRAFTRIVFVPASGSAGIPVTDDRGAVLAASTPVVVWNAGSAYFAQLSGTMDTAAGQGKLDI
jgi:hypothetical protein